MSFESSAARTGAGTTNPTAPSASTAGAMYFWISDFM